MNVVHHYHRLGESSERRPKETQRSDKEPLSREDKGDFEDTQDGTSIQALWEQLCRVKRWPSKQQQPNHGDFNFLF